MIAAVPGHDRRCDSDLCHPDCPTRKRAIANDRHYPGKPRGDRRPRRVRRG